MLKRVILTAAILAFTAPVMAIADDSHSHHPGEKLAHGVGETATGWVEAPKEIVEESKRTNPVVGVTKGAIVGTAKAVEKTVKGVAKAATFFIPSDKE